MDSFSGVYRAEDIERVVDPTLVECIGGPHDGEFRRADENGLRPNGIYVVVNNECAPGKWRVVARRYVPFKPHGV